MKNERDRLPLGLAEFESKIEKKQIKVGLVGFGYIGTCIGAVIADRGFEVIGIDVRERVIAEINRGETSVAEPGLPDLIRSVVERNLLKATTDFSALADCDVVVVTVGTPLGKNFDPDTKDIISASESVAKYSRPGQLIILKSTVPPGTTENVVVPALQRVSHDQQFHVAFCPERLAEGKAISEFKSIPVVVGGINQKSSEFAAAFWRGVLNIQTIVVENARAAELVKLADNWWIDLNIALANEVALLSEKIGVDALQVIAAANSLPKGQHHVNILFPSIGVGGYCLTKDPWFVDHLGKTFELNLRTPSAGRHTNDSMPDHSFNLISSSLNQTGRSLASSKVAVLGVSFKNNTGDCRFTPTKPIINRLRASGCKLEICDPWVHDEEAQTVVGGNLNRDMLQAMKDADCLAFFTGHDEFKNITVTQMQELLKPGAVIFDGRNFMSRERIQELRKAGFLYRGVGR